MEALIITPKLLVCAAGWMGMSLTGTENPRVGPGVGSGYKHEPDVELPLRHPDGEAERADDKAAGLRGAAGLGIRIRVSPTERWVLTLQGVVGQMRTVLGLA